MESNSLMIFQSSNEKLKPIFSQVKLLVKINDLSLKLVALQDRTKDFIPFDIFLLLLVRNLRLSQREDDTVVGFLTILQLFV